MPAELLEHQLEISDLNDETRALVFGTVGTGYLTLTPPAWKSGDARDGDVARPQEDGIYFGRDLRGAASVGFEIGVITDKINGLDDGDAYRANVDYTNDLQEWWDDEDLRTKPWHLAMLRACVAGRTWRAYGRPRRFDAATSRLTQQGYTPVVCDFVVGDNCVYADVSDSVEIPLVSEPDGGMVAPLIAPLTTTLSTHSERPVVITGNRKTWAWVTFVGPVTNPQVQLIETSGPVPRTLTVGLSGSIPDDMTVTVDPRPWSRGVIRNDGANYAGMLSPLTPVLREMKLRKGNYRALYSGTDATGTSSCIVEWRAARGRL